MTKKEKLVLQVMIDVAEDLMKAGFVERFIVNDKSEKEDDLHIIWTPAGVKFILTYTRALAFFRTQDKVQSDIFHTMLENQARNMLRRPHDEPPPLQY